jgi:hypothetical protein
MRHPVRGLMAGAAALLAATALSPIPAKAFPAGSPAAKADARSAGELFDDLALSLGFCAAINPCSVLLSGITGWNQSQQLLTAFISGVAGARFDHAAGDPIDLNFMTVASPVPTTLPFLGLFPPPSLVSLLTAEADAGGLVDATVTAFTGHREHL